MMRWYSILISVLVSLAILFAPRNAAAVGTWISSSETLTPTGSVTLPCADATAVQTLYIAFQPDQDIPDCREVDFTVLMDSSEPYLYCGHDPPQPPPLAPFWLFAPPLATCNEGGLVAWIDPVPPNPNVATLWTAGASFGTALANNTQRVGVWIGIAPPTPITLRAGVRYYGATIKIPMCTSPTCTGCDASLIATVEGDAVVGGIGNVLGIDQFWINVQGVCSTTPPIDLQQVRQMSRQLASIARPYAAQSLCDVVPVRPHTWGSLKLLYR